MGETVQKHLDKANTAWQELAVTSGSPRRGTMICGMLRYPFRLRRVAMSEARKHQIQRPRPRRLPQSLENALGVLVQAIVLALSLAGFIAVSEPSAIQIDSVQLTTQKTGTAWCKDAAETMNFWRDGTACRHGTTPTSCALLSAHF